MNNSQCVYKTTDGYCELHSDGIECREPCFEESCDDMKELNAKTVYIAGKITGDPNFKDKFQRAKKMLSEKGFIVVSPTVLPDTGFSWAAYMRMTTAMLQECDAVYVLQDWRDSKGAKIEVKRARTEGKKIIFAERRESNG